MKRKAFTVPERLRDLGAIYESRASMYGDNYKHFGKVMIGAFPRGLHLQTEDDFARFGIYVQIMSKMTRYAQSFHCGHSDSLDDAAVYSQMLREVDYDIFVGKVRK